MMIRFHASKTGSMGSAMHIIDLNKAFLCGVESVFFFFFLVLTFILSGQIHHTTN